MKRYFVAIISILALTISVYGGMGGGGMGGGGMGGGGMGGGGMGGGRGGNQGGAMGGGRGGAMGGGTTRSGGSGFLNVDSINTAIKAIEEQLALVKKALESSPAATTGSTPTSVQPGGADLQTIMEQMQQRTTTVQTAGTSISEQTLVLKGSQAQLEQQAEIAELQSIITAANEEKATKTATLVQSIIDARQKEFQATAAKLGIAVQSQTQRGGRGGAGGGRGGGMGGGGRGAAFTPPEGGFKYND
jgi:hypothetical protein